MKGSSASVTVVMPVFNALPYLDQAVKSIVGQSHGDFELAIYDDHSTDGSFEAALEWSRRDPRVSVVRGNARLGPSGSSNAAADLARSEFVARMDADDVAYPDRLEVQLAALRRHPEAVMIGSTFDMIDGEERIIRRALMRANDSPFPPMVHSTLFYRRAAFERAGGYRHGTDYYEDHDLYRRMAAVGAVLVLNRPLVGFRYAGQHSRLRDDRQTVIEQTNLLVDVGDASAPGGRTTSPMSFYTIAVLSIQALERPRLLGLMMRKVHFRQPVRTAAVMAVIALAELAPRLARRVVLALYYLRDRAAHGTFEYGSVYTWRVRQA